MLLKAFFLLFSPPIQTASALKTHVLGFLLKFLYYALYRSVMQSRNSASFSFAFAIFLPFCRLLEKALSAHARSVFRLCLTWQNNYTLVPPAGSGLLLWAFTTASAVLWGHTNILNHLRPLTGCFLCKWRENRSVFQNIRVYADVALLLIWIQESSFMPSMLRVWWVSLVWVFCRERWQCCGHKRRFTKPPKCAVCHAVCVRGHSCSPALPAVLIR